MERPTHEQRKLLKKLSEKAYELELSKSLKNLRDEFHRWESGEISPWDLSNAIHEYHDGEAQDLYRFYTMGTDYTFHVANAIKRGFLSMDDVPETCRERVQYVIETLDI